MYSAKRASRLSLFPDLCSERNRLVRSNLGTKSNFPLANHSPIGTPNPFLDLLTILGGSILEHAFFKIYLVTPLFSLRLARPSLNSVLGSRTNDTANGRRIMIRLIFLKYFLTVQILK